VFTLSDVEIERKPMLEAPKIEKGPGLRGKVTFFVKRVIRRFSRWYVEPRFDELRALHEDQQRSIVFLRKELDHIHREMSQLSLRLHQLEDRNKASQ
jgi:hypothetical protein